MMKVKGEPLEEAKAILGEGGEAEVTFLVIPMNTYKIVSDQASKEGCSAAQVFQKAVLQYIQTANEPKVKPALPTPDIVIRRRRP